MTDENKIEGTQVEETQAEEVRVEEIQPEASETPAAVVEEGDEAAAETPATQVVEDEDEGEELDTGPEADDIPVAEENGGHDEEEKSHKVSYSEGPAIFTRAGEGRRRNPRHVGREVRLEDIDYRNVQVLRRFVDNRGRIYSRRKTRVSARMQRKVTKAIKRARHLALMPYTGEHIRITRKRGSSTH